MQAIVKELSARRPIDRRLAGFAGSNTGGQRAAAMYTLIGSAKLNGMDPEAYLSHVLARIASHPITRIDEFLPWNAAFSSCSCPAHPAKKEVTNGYYRNVVTNRHSLEAHGRIRGHD